MKYEVRRWTKKDFPFIREIALTSGLDDYSNLFDRDNLDITYKNYYNNKSLNKIFKNRIGFVGTNDDGLIGYLVLQEKQNDKQIYINSFFVLPKFNVFGIREQLLDIATQQVKTMGYNKIWLEVIIENIKANDWFKSKGFIFDQKRIYKNGATETGIILAFKEIL